MKVPAKTLLAILGLWVAHPAVGAEIQPGELHHTAQTMPKGEYALHAFPSASMVGITDRFDMKSNILGLITGVNASGEVILVEDASHTASIEPRFWIGWKGGSHTLGGEVRYTAHLASGELTAGVGVYRDVLQVEADFENKDVDYIQLTRLFLVAGHYARIDDSEGHFDGMRTPLLLSYDHRLGERSRLSLVTRTNITNISRRQGHWLIARPTWTTAPSETMRLALGAWIFLPYLVPPFEDDELDDDMDELLGKGGFRRRVNLPVPYLAMWWVI